MATLPNTVMDCLVPTSPAPTNPVEATVSFDAENQTVTVCPHTLGVVVGQTVVWNASGFPNGHEIELTFQDFPGPNGPFSAMIPETGKLTGVAYNPVFDGVTLCHVSYSAGVKDAAGKRVGLPTDPLIDTLGDPTPIKP